jgi:hypothetical protein
VEHLERSAELCEWAGVKNRSEEGNEVSAGALANAVALLKIGGSSFSVYARFAYREKSSVIGLIFNQLICEFASRHPCQLWANAERDYIC